jgi:hypothetical protein
VKLNCVEIKRGWLFAEKNARGRRRNGRRESHKLNIIDGFTNKIIQSDIPLVILSVKSVTSPYDLPFLNSIVILFVILLVYTE